MLGNILGLLFSISALGFMLAILYPVAKKIQYQMYLFDKKVQHKIYLHDTRMHIRRVLKSMKITIK